MNKEDMTLDDKVYELFRDSIEEDGNVNYSKSKFAAYAGIKRSTFFDNSEKKVNNLNITVLTQLLCKVKVDKNERINKIFPKLQKIYQRELFRVLDYSKYEFIDALHSDQMIRFINSSSKATLIKPADLHIRSNLKNIFSQGSEIKRLNLLLHHSDIAKYIDDIEQWAYSSEGDFSNVLTINIYEDELDSEVEIIGFMTQNKFHSYVKHVSGYIPMDETGYELLLDHERRLFEEIPVWQLLKTPASRKIMQLMRNPKIKFQPEIIDFLINKIYVYEANQNIEAAQNIFDNLKDEICATFGEQSAEDFSQNIIYFTLMT